MNSNNPHTVLIDCNNLFHIQFHTSNDDDDSVQFGLVYQKIFYNLKYYFDKFKPLRMVCVFDDSSWRKIYTNKANPITHKKYKGHRKKDKTPKELEKLKKLDNHIKEFKEFLYNHSTVKVLCKKFLEADDLISGYVQMFPAENHIIVSSDKDFLQLVCDNVSLYNPVEDKFRNLKEWNDDPKLFLFEKLFRGDSGDNVISSYPRLRKTKIEQAYTDDYKFNNLMQHTFEIEDIDAESGDLKKYTYTTKDLYEENRLLMDLKAQPDNIKQLINSSIHEELERKSGFSLFHFLKFCGKYELQRLIDESANFVRMFTH